MGVVAIGLSGSESQSSTLEVAKAAGRQYRRAPPSGRVSTIPQIRLGQRLAQRDDTRCIKHEFQFLRRQIKHLDMIQMIVGDSKLLDRFHDVDAIDLLVVGGRLLTYVPLQVRASQVDSAGFDQ